MQKKASEARETERAAAADQQSPGGEKTAQRDMGQTEGAARNVRKPLSPMRYAQRALLWSLIIVLLIYLLFGWVVGVMKAPSDDMTPRIDGHDLLLYYRLEKDVKAGDVIILVKNSTTYLGRVIAASGDTVDITDEESVCVNGNTLTESRIYSSTPRYEGFVDYPLTLGADECFVLVDRRNGGEDSRYYGPVSRSEIKGVVITIMRRNNL